MAYSRNLRSLGNSIQKLHSETPFEWMVVLGCSWLYMDGWSFVRMVIVLFISWLLKVNYPPPLVDSERSNPFVRALNDEDTCDITFIVENRKIYAHISILKICSEYFRKMFNAKFKETKTGEIHVEDTSYDVFFAYLLYIYSNDVNAAGDDLMDLFELSHKYCDEAE